MPLFIFFDMRFIFFSRPNNNISMAKDKKFPYIKKPLVSKEGDFLCASADCVGWQISNKKV